MIRHDPWTIPDWESAKADRNSTPVQVILRVEQMDGFREWAEALGLRIVAVPVGDDLATFTTTPERPLPQERRWGSTFFGAGLRSGR